MDAELLQILSIIFFIMSGILLVTAIVLFFLMDIPKLFGDVSGRTAKKAIEEIRNKNENVRNQNTGDSMYKTGEGKREREKITDKITKSGKLFSRNETSDIGLGTERLINTDFENSGNETSVLGADGTVQGETSVLGADGAVQGETSVLGAGGTVQGETSVLGQGYGGSPVNYGALTVYNGFYIDVDILLTGSSEFIE